MCLFSSLPSHAMLSFCIRTVNAKTEEEKKKKKKKKNLRGKKYESLVLVIWASDAQTYPTQYSSGMEPLRWSKLQGVSAGRMRSMRSMRSHPSLGRALSVHGPWENIRQLRNDGVMRWVICITWMNLSQTWSISGMDNTMYTTQTGPGTWNKRRV